MVISVDGVVRTKFGQVDVCNGNFISLRLVDNVLLEFHQVSGCAGWCRVLDALADVGHQTINSVVCCALPSRSKRTASRLVICLVRCSCLSFIFWISTTSILLRYKTSAS